LPDLGDGRPDEQLADQSPMDYNKRSSREDELDLRDREEVFPDEYVPPAKVPPRPGDRTSVSGRANVQPPPTPQSVPRVAEAAVGGPIFELVGIVPQHAAPAEITCQVLGELCKFLPDELEELGRTMLIVAHTARLIRA
jgi:hypothetical protein